MDIELHHRNFCSLLGDAIFFEKMAHEHNDRLLSQRYARVSIISSLLTLECAANCCLFCVQGNTQLLNELDKLNALAKLDFFAWHGYEKKIDWGRAEVQKIKELKQLRDSFVHPKVIKNQTNISNVSELKDFYSVTIQFESKQKNSTKIDINSNLWFHKDALSALKAVVEFYNYYFTDLISLDPDLVFGILNTSIIVDSKPFSSVYPPTLFEEIQHLESTGIKVKFIRNKP